MVLADTSVWIDYFNGVPTWQSERLDLLLDTEPVALGDLILTEVLQGFRNDSDFRKAQAFLAELPFYELGGYAVCLQAARNYRALRAKGITVHKTIDAIIATACIEWNFKLLHNDRDFDALQKTLDYNWFRNRENGFAKEFLGEGKGISRGGSPSSAS